MPVDAKGRRRPTVGAMIRITRFGHTGVVPLADCPRGPGHGVYGRLVSALIQGQHIRLAPARVQEVNVVSRTVCIRGRENPR